jgi:hypothetical protein
MFIACGEGEEKTPIWDVMSAVDVVISVENANGNNLLDPDYEGNIIDDITIEQDDKVYTIKQAGTDSLATRALPPPQWYGLRLFYDQHSSETVLLFGEFGRCHGKTFTINWGDGTSDEIMFDFYVEMEGRKKDQEPHVYLKIWLNGELQSDDSLVVTIVK